MPKKGLQSKTNMKAKIMKLCDGKPQDLLQLGGLIKTLHGKNPVGKKSKQEKRVHDLELTLPINK